MNELTIVRTLRDDVTEPEPHQLAAPRAQLDAAIVGAHPRQSRARKASWTIAAAAAAIVATLVAGNISINVQSAQAVAVLRAAATETINLADPTLGSGQYLRARTHTNWGGSSIDDDGNVVQRPNEQMIEVYVPSDPSADWVLYRDWGTIHGPTGQGIETTRVPNGEFYGSPWISPDLPLHQIPTGDGRTVS